MEPDTPNLLGTFSGSPDVRRLQAGINGVPGFPGFYKFSTH